MSNNLYTLVIDSELDGKFRELQSRFKPGEKIISTSVSGDKMLVTTECPALSDRNLLLEDIKSGKIDPKKFGKVI